MPLSAAQLGVWVAHNLNPSSSAYNIGEYLEIEGSVDPARFEQALRQVIAEAETLRIQIVVTAGQPQQAVTDVAGWSMPFIDVSGEADPRSAALWWMRAELTTPVDLTRGPLFCFALFKASADRFYWYARYHHIVLDGYGMWLVAQRVAEVYTALGDGAEVAGETFGPLSVLLDEDAAYRTSERFADDRQHWASELADRPEPDRVSFGERPAGTSSATSGNAPRVTTYLEDACVDALRSVAQRAGTTLPRLLVAAAVIFQHRLTGAGDVVVGLPVAARDGASRRVPGMTSNVLPLRALISPSMTVFDALERVIDQIKGVLAHEQYQFADLRRDLGLLGDGGGRLFGTSINVLPFQYDFRFSGHRAIASNLSLGPVNDLSIAIYTHHPLRVDFDGNSTLYSADALADLQQRFVRLLAALTEPDRPIGTLAIVSAEERATLLEGWNATARPVAGASLPALFAAQAARTPEAVAVLCEGRQLSYAALLAQSNRLAHHLRARGVGPETVVGLCVERSPEMLVGLLGILNAGAAYLPLDPGYPAERLAFMLADAGCPVLVGQARLLGALAGRHSHPGAARRRRTADRAPAGQRTASRPRPATPGLRHLHLRLDRNPQGRRRHAREPCQQDAGAGAGLCGRTAIPRRLVHLVLVRRLDRADAAAADG